MSKPANGVLPAPSAIMKKPGSSTTPATKPVVRAPDPKLKLILRRLAPGLTQTELENALGDEWKAGGGKVEWYAYKQGKISKDPAKPSRPSRAYFKVKDQSFVTLLSDKIKQTTFQDARNSSKDSCLLGPPSLEYASYSRVPGARVRKDGRQGTIDQEQEFIEFLQNLTEPVTKAVLHADGGDTVDAKAEKVTTTPLIQYLKEKKANKSKEAAAAKAAKAQSRQEAKEQKAEKAKAESEAKKATAAKKEANNAAMAEKQARIEKARQEAVKAAQKQAAITVAKQSANTVPTSPSPKKSSASPAPAPAPAPVKRERERGNARAAAAILQRDLGLTTSPRGDRRAARRSAPNQPSDTSKPTTSTETKESNQSNEAVPSGESESQASIKPQSGEPATTTTPTQAPTGPRNTPKKPNPPVVRQPPNPRPPPPPKPAPQPSPGAKSAFLKHANPSQGVTELLLQEAFSVFGAVTKCEIDKKKGFGYVDFAAPEGLQEAMKNSPVKVGNGQVVVLEKKDRPAPKLQNSNVSKAPANPPAPVPAAAPANTPASNATPTPAPATATSTPPTAPRGNAAPTGPSRGGIRGGMAPRGGFGHGGRGPRGGFRGGRGGFQGTARGGAAVSPAAQASQPAQPMATGETK
ncbi:MAG: hypothetical protein Q9160_000557 [Pyrenula sp. 1 TL-2023]